MGGHRPIVWDGKLNDKKINNIKYIVAFGGHRLPPYHATPNHNHADAAKVSVGRRFGQAGAQGGY